MINFGSNPAFILGIALVLCGVALYAMRSVRPELSRDHDIFFAAIALISGLILMFQGWRLDPLLLLGQLALAGSSVFFAVENIRLRGVTTEQAKRNSPIVDDDRPVSRSYEYDYDYQADFEELPSVENRRSARRIRASRDARGATLDDYERSSRRPPDSSRRRLEPEDDYSSRYNSRRRPLPRSRQRRDDISPAPAPIDRAAPAPQWEEDVNDIPDEVAFSPETGDSTYRSTGREPKSLSRYRRRRSSSDRYPNPGVAAAGGSAEYADYQPIDYSDDEPDSSGDYGDRYR